MKKFLLIMTGAILGVGGYIFGGKIFDKILNWTDDKIMNKIKLTAKEIYEDVTLAIMVRTEGVQKGTFAQTWDFSMYEDEKVIGLTVYINPEDKRLAQFENLEKVDEEGFVVHGATVYKMENGDFWWAHDGVIMG